MCTASWIIRPDGYSLFFNRDERRTRSEALLPEVTRQSGMRIVMPKDPDGGGTWIAMNDAGVSVCLLNYYQGKIPYGTLVSRGQLVVSLADCRNVEEVNSRLTNLPLHKMAPFTLLLFTPDISKQRRPHAWQWDGLQLTPRVVTAPVISSAVCLEEVVHSRTDLYCQMSPKTEEGALAFHRSHKPGKGFLSVCMHREDASSVSLTHVSVSGDEMEMDYYPGSPCTCDIPVKTMISRPDAAVASEGVIRKRKRI
ncbi:NRDE family protein [Parasalinivibrio latis]|uniref:NRDE family protein n=1 Tax=Parasalinivibrio latis TaxID=2952610 RepID=UPI0030DF3F14